MSARAKMILLQGKSSGTCKEIPVCVTKKVNNKGQMILDTGQVQNEQQLDPYIKYKQAVSSTQEK